MLEFPRALASIASVYLGKQSYAESRQSLTTRGLGFCQEEQNHVLQMSDAQIPPLSQVNVKSPYSLWEGTTTFILTLLAIMVFTSRVVG